MLCLRIKEADVPAWIEENSHIPVTFLREGAMKTGDGYRRGGVVRTAERSPTGEKEWTAEFLIFPKLVV